MRILRTIAAFLFVAAVITASAQNVTTQISATSVNNGSNTVSGKMCYMPGNQYGNPIPIVKFGGGFYQKGSTFCGTLVDGSLVSSISVPDSATDSQPGHTYVLVIYDTVNKTTSDPLIIPGISGANWSLDTYVPAFSVPTTNALTFTTGSSTPSGSCTAPALYSKNVSGTATLYVCAAGAWVAAAGGGGGGGGETYTASAPLSVDEAGNFSLPAATNGVNGYLTSADHTAFNAKQPAGSYATLVSGHIPAEQMPTSIAALEVRFLAAAVCNGGVAYSAGLSTYDNQQPQFGCIASATSAAAYMAFQAAASPLQYASATFSTPPYWVGTDLSVTFRGTATTGNVSWVIESGCTNAGGDISSVTYGTAVTLTTTVSATSGGVVNSAVTTNIAVPATNGCTASTNSPSSLVTLRIHRAPTDTQTGDAHLLGITITTRRSQ